MFPNSLLFAFVATCLFLANVGAEAGSAPNRPDGFDSYPSDHFRKARMDKRYIPHSVFQGYQAKAKRDGRVFVRRSDDEYGGSRPEFQPAEFEKRSVGEDADDGIGGHWSIAKRNDEDDGDKGLFDALNKRSLPPTAAANLEKRSPLEISKPKVAIRTVGTVQKAQQPTPGKYSQGPDLVGPTYQRMFFHDFIYNYGKITGATGSSGQQGGDSSFSSVQEFINQAQKTTKCTWLSPADVHCRCSDAGGTNKGEFTGPKAWDQDNDTTVPGLSERAKPKVGEGPGSSDRLRRQA
ncbi:hypothetical protein NDA11_002476 [Ustilago hordei]|nr:hypothetical protein NDA11_002476 [Ustilago hordei]